METTKATLGISASSTGCSTPCRNATSSPATETRVPGTSGDAGAGDGRKPETEGRHALLSPSSAARWLHCPPSARLEERFADGGSSFAEEGTLAHALGAKYVKERFGLPTDSEEREIGRLWDEYGCGEMLELMEGYAEYVCGRYGAHRAWALDGEEPTLRVEQQLDLGHIIPEGFGTGDVVIASEGEIEIIDLKYGKGVKVSAEGNPQMMIYALGALDLLDWKYEVEKVRMTVYQPRLGNLSSWETTVGELKAWVEEELRPGARLAFAGRGLFDAGDWCRFCRARGSCRHLALANLQLAERFAGGPELSAEDRGRILGELPRFKKWISEIEEGSLSLALAGERIPGWKVVEGRRVRKVTDPAGLAERLLGEGFAEGGIYKARELQTLTALEKLCGRKRFAQLSEGFVGKAPGKPTLAREEDSREGFDEFAGMV